MSDTIKGAVIGAIITGIFGFVGAVITGNMAKDQGGTRNYKSIKFTNSKCKWR